MTTQKSEAVCGGETAYYDCNSEKLYEFESECLTPDMMQWLEELLTSHYVTKNGSASSKVLITDYTYEVADDDTEKYIVKFTWKYADNRLTLEKPYEGNAKVFTQPLFLLRLRLCILSDSSRCICRFKVQCK